jgi:glycosyltransferase involved in cell wall biosynthesis
MKLSVVMPVYNEIARVETAVRRVFDACGVWRKELIIVDDGSTDGTREYLETFAASNGKLVDGGVVKVFFHEQNLGKGAAIATAIRHVSGDMVIIQDADLEYDPGDYPALIQPVHDGLADVVFGNRFHGGGPHRVLYFWHYMGNRILTMLCNMLTNLNLTDMEVGYKVFRTDIFKQLQIQSNRFGFEPEITVKIAKLGCRIYEVPIAYHGRTYAEGKKIGWRDGLAAIYHIVRYRFFD